MLDFERNYEDLVCFRKAWPEPCRDAIRPNEPIAASLLGHFPCQITPPTLFSGVLSCLNRSSTTIYTLEELSVIVCKAYNLCSRF
jgi:hypothetical protein